MPPQRTIRDESGKPFSRWKPIDKFLYKWNLDGIPGGEPVREYEFDADRKWRFDFAWPDQKLAIEFDGYGFGHQERFRVTENLEKQNAAVEQGWRVLRFTATMMGSKEKVDNAVRLVTDVLLSNPNGGN